MASLRRHRALVLGSVAALACTSPVRAQSIAELSAKIDAAQRELTAQRELIENQAQRIAEQQAEIDRLQGQVLAAASLADLRGAGLAPAAPAAPQVQAAVSPPNQPVGDAPDLPSVEQTVEAVPEGMGVLTRAGRFVLDLGVEYTNSSNNRLVFRGIELIPGIQLGVIEASDADRNTVVGTAALRYGLTNNIELEARVPFLSRSDRIEVVQQREGTVVRQLKLGERNIGDVEFAIRYQLNRPVGQRPIFVGSLRVKSDTGKSPFEIPFDDFGVATGLATGSGFWAVQPGLNFLLPSDPAVIFGGVSYLYHIPKDIDRTIGDVFIGRVDPGDAIQANLGFGFALNPRFSFSLGYRHSYIYPTRTEVGSTHQRSSGLHVGVFSLGTSYRLTERRSLNFGVELGATEDAPDVSITLRMPLTLN